MFQYDAIIWVGFSLCDVIEPSMSLLKYSGNQIVLEDSGQPEQILEPLLFA